MQELNLIEILDKINEFKELKIKIAAELDQKKKEYAVIVKELDDLGITDIKAIKSHMNELKENLDKDLSFINEMIETYKGKYHE